jgi:hypothetical protein
MIDYLLIALPCWRRLTCCSLQVRQTKMKAIGWPYRFPAISLPFRLVEKGENHLKKLDTSI